MCLLSTVQQHLESLFTIPSIPACCFGEFARNAFVLEPHACVCLCRDVEMPGAPPPVSQAEASIRERLLLTHFISVRALCKFDYCFGISCSISSFVLDLLQITMELQTKLHALEVGPVPTKASPSDVETGVEGVDSATLRDSFVGMSLSANNTLSDVMNTADVPPAQTGAPPVAPPGTAPFGVFVRTRFNR
jgi:hypothetical protein